MKRDPSTPLRLQLRTYACTEPEAAFGLRLNQLLETCPALRSSYLVEAGGGTVRLGGMNQFGDVLIRPERHGEDFLVRVEHRAGDGGLVLAMEHELRDVLTPRPNAPSPIKNRLPGMASFFQMIQEQPLGRKVIIADSTIESALGLDFSGYREARHELEILARLQTLRGTRPTESRKNERRHHPEMDRYPEAKVCLFHGKKVWLPYSVTAHETTGGRGLTMHFTLLPTGKPLVGWVEERPF
jgi:hypothetical protein